MIQSRADVMDLLNAYLVTQHEWTHQFWMLGSEGWSGEKEAMNYVKILIFMMT